MLYIQLNNKLDNSMKLKNWVIKMHVPTHYSGKIKWNLKLLHLD